MEKKGRKTEMQKLESPKLSLQDIKREIRKTVMNALVAFSEMRIFFKSHLLEFHKILHEDTSGNK